MTNTVGNILYRFLCKHKFLFLCDKCKRVELLGFIVTVCSFCCCFCCLKKKLLNYFPVWLSLFTFPPKTHKWLNLATSMLTFGVVTVLFLNSGKNLVIATDHLMYISLMAYGVTNLSVCLFAFQWHVSVSFLTGLFVFLLLSIDNSSFMLDT
jgi:hypothetical protein